MLLVFALIFGAAAGGVAHARPVPFTTQTAISTSADSARSTYAADVDGDGDLDALSASYYDDKIAWYENAGGGGTSWALHTIATTADGARSVYAADVDGDGDLDALSASFLDDEIAWYENASGGGTSWALHTIAATADGAQSVYAADVDGDSDLDVLSASELDDEIAWYENVGGAGTDWALHVIATTADGARSVYAADVDGDGDLDALSASFLDDEIAWYENAGGGTSWALHTIATTANEATAVYAADVDGDGDLDALSASRYDSKIAWYENVGGGGTSWTLHTISTTANYATSVYAADVDGDGDLDALSASQLDDKIAWYENAGGGGTSWILRTIATNAEYASAVFAADVDGDGDLDALSSSEDDQVVWYRNDTIHRNATHVAPGPISTTADAAALVYAADVDGDGDLDALSASYSDDKIAWYENVGGGGTGWTRRTISTTADGALSVYAADVDGDGDLDALSASRLDNEIAWYENVGGGGTSWTLHTISTTADSARFVYAADVDGDGDLDALSASYVDDKVAWYENVGGGGTAWTLRTISTTANGAISVYAADVDGDGDLDALSASQLDAKIAWYENVGGGGTAWTLCTIATTANAAQSVYAADVDGDGDLDALSASRYGTTIAWYENAGGGTSWTRHTISTTADNARSVYAADVDGDGDLDVLSASFDDDKIAWYENVSGAGTDWALHVIATTADGARSVYAADMDGDGDLDALSASRSDDKIAWYENRGGQLALPTANTAAARVGDSALDDLLRIDVTHRGRSGDSAVEPERLSLLFEATPGVPLTSSEAGALLDDLHLYRDDGSGTFEAGADTLVTTASDLTLAAGVLTFLLPDDTSELQVPFATGTRTYFVVPQWAADASTQTPDNLRVTHLTATAPTSAGEDAAADVPLILEHAADVASAVVEVNDPPVAVGDAPTAIDEDSSLTPAPPGVLVNDSDEEDPLTAVLDAGPLHAQSFSLAADGSFSYVPVADYSGPDGFTYQAHDGFVSSNVATVSITVAPVADAPTLETTDASGLVDSDIPLSITAALADVDGSETLSITVAGVPAGATLSAGTDLGGGVWLLTQAQLAGLTLTPAPGSDADLALVVTATATETANADAEATVRNLTVVVQQPGEIFEDGFETGDTSRWSLQVPTALQRWGQRALVETGAASFAYDLASLLRRDELGPSPLAVVRDALGSPLFTVEARRLDADSPAELRLVGAGAQGPRTTEWQAVAARRQDLRLEWQPGAAAGGGTLALYLDGRLALWLDGLEATQQQPAVLELWRIKPRAF